MKTVLVTGGTGFVGANLVRCLLDRGDRNVRVFVRESSDRRNLDGLGRDGAVEFCTGDLRDRASVSRAVRGCQEVYHVAADYRFWANDYKELHESNVGGTRNILEECLARGVDRVVYTSTVGTIGLADQPRPCTESTAMDPHQVTSHYKRSKIAAEKVALELARRGLPVVIVNPSTPIGAWDRKPTPTGKIIVDFANGKMPAYVETGLNFAHVEDVAEGHVLAAEKGRVGNRYILGNHNLTLGQFLEIAACKIGRTAPKMVIPYPVALATGWLSTVWADLVTHKEPGVALEAVRMSRRYMYFDSTKAVRELELKQRPIEDAISDAVDWFVANGYFDRMQDEPRRRKAWLFL